MSTQPTKLEWSSKYPAGEIPAHAKDMGVSARIGDDGKQHACREHRWQVVVSQDEQNGSRCSIGQCTVYRSVITGETVHSSVLGPWSCAMDRRDWERRNAKRTEIRAAQFVPFAQYDPH